jgi:CubicO group peptidase (beta-lactamase class C family)
MQLGKLFSTIAAVLYLLTGRATGQGTDGRAPQPPATSVAPTLDTFILQRMDEAGIVGIGAAIIVDKKVEWMKGYGFADRERAVPFGPDTVMNIGSISKTFTGVAMMRAVEERKLSLDEDINRYLPFRVVNPHYPDAKITLRHLATHTSGITDRWEVYKEAYHYEGSAPEPLGEFLESYFAPGGTRYSKENFLNVKPGTHRDYSNIASGLAGYIVELSVGEKLGAYARKHIFSPLRMKETAWSLADVERAKHAKLYVAQDDLTSPISLYELTTYPDGGVRTSVADLSKLFIALLNDGVYQETRILEKPSVDEMLRFQYTKANKPDNVGLEEKNSGLFWSTKFNVTRIGHGGSDPGLKTEMLSSLSKDVGVILFANTSMPEKDMRKYVDIFLEIWKQAEGFKKAKGP